MLLEGYGSYEGAYELSVSCATPCGDALAALGGVRGRARVRADRDGRPSGAVSVAARAARARVVRAYARRAVDELTFDTCASDFDTYLRLYSVARCDDTCASARNGVCGDGRSNCGGGGGGYGYGYSATTRRRLSCSGGSYGGGHGAACALGTDCTDCGPVDDSATGGGSPGTLLQSCDDCGSCGTRADEHGAARGGGYLLLLEGYANSEGAYSLRRCAARSGRAARASACSAAAARARCTAAMRA